MQQQTYRRLNDFEREEISRGIEAGRSFVAIARLLGRHTSTISREVCRNSGKTGYRAFSAKQRGAHAAALRRKGRSILTRQQQLRQYVIAGLRKCWSPREIVIRMKAEYPVDMSMRISHEAIYRYIYVLPRGTLKAVLIKGLRQERAYRRTKKTSNHEEKRGKIADMLSIEERPKEVEDRAVPGHWEGDLVVGKYKRSAIGTLVERTTRYVIIVPLKAKDATSVREAYAREFQKLPKEITKTLTYDQGKEMSEHKQFSIDTAYRCTSLIRALPGSAGPMRIPMALFVSIFPKEQSSIKFRCVNSSAYSGS
jgi:IS30 family transposase